MRNWPRGVGFAPMAPIGGCSIGPQGRRKGGRISARPLSSSETKPFELVPPLLLAALCFAILRSSSRCPEGQLWPLTCGAKKATPTTPQTLSCLRCVAFIAGAASCRCNSFRGSQMVALQALALAAASISEAIFGLPNHAFPVVFANVCWQLFFVRFEDLLVCSCVVLQVANHLSDRLALCSVSLD